MPSDLNKGRKERYLNIKALTVEIGKEGGHHICYKMTPKYSTMNQKKKMLEWLFLGHPVQFGYRVDHTLDSNGY